MTVELKHNHRVTVNGRTEIGTLVADDTGVGVKTRRKMFSRSQLGTFYIFKWPDVTQYRIGVPNTRMLAGSTLNSHHTQVDFWTAGNVFSWELPLDRAVVMNRLGKYLSTLPSV